jgi:hypothetical protein
MTVVLGLFGAGFQGFLAFSVGFQICPLVGTVCFTMLFLPPSRGLSMFLFMRTVIGSLIGASSLSITPVVITMAGEWGLFAPVAALRALALSSVEFGVQHDFTLTAFIAVTAVIMFGVHA